jgi:hypothetical protein
MSESSGMRDENPQEFLSEYNKPPNAKGKVKQRGS